MKKLHNLTEKEARHICKLIDEPFISLLIFKKPRSNCPIIQIHTTSTVYGNEYDSILWIYLTGTVELFRNNGRWNGSKYVTINALLITDYLREQGYFFNKTSHPKCKKSNYESGQIH